MTPPIIDSLNLKNVIKFNYIYVASIGPQDKMCSIIIDDIGYYLLFFVLCDIIHHYMEATHIVDM